MRYISNLFNALKDKFKYKSKYQNKTTPDIDDTESHIKKYNDTEGKSHWFGNIGKKE